MITRSNGYRLNEDTVGNLPFFYLQSRSLTAADQLVKAQKLEQALEAYRHDYARDPQDDHALKMLVHLMTAKASYTKDKSLEAATIPLLVKLVELRPTADSVFNLALYYYEQSDWKSYNHYYSWFLELRDQKPNSYDLGINATALMHQGNWTKPAGNSSPHWRRMAPTASPAPIWLQSWRRDSRSMPY